MVRFEISIDDGDTLDLRVADMLQAHGFRGIFFIPTNKTSLSGEEIIRLSRVHEIGAHTVNHPQDLKILPHPELKAELENSREILRKLTGQKVDKFCYPRGRYNEIVKSAVREAGYTYARTTQVGCTRSGVDPYEVETTVHLYPRHEYEGLDILVYAKQKMDEALAGGGYFHLWLHSWEVDKLGLWEKLEQILVLMETVKRSSR